MKFTRRYIFFSIVTILLICSGCKEVKKTNEVKTSHNPLSKQGSFGYDVDFLKAHYNNTLILFDGESKILVTPELQGRVMTSTAEGDSGQSFGWINYDYIASGKNDDHFNPIGGEERIWLGPEGGQFSLFFKPESDFSFDNWYVPKELDIEPFNLVWSSTNEAYFEKNLDLLNYSNNILKIQVNRKIRVLSTEKSGTILNVKIPETVKIVGFETENTIKNTGDFTWDKITGMPSIWVLCMLKHSNKTTIVAPFKRGDDSKLGKIVTDDYFGKVPADRLKVKDSVLFFKADGKKRSKIGISPKRAIPIFGSYDPLGGVLTIAQFTLPENNTDYVNSLWEIQKEPFNGDAVNFYNDGPLGDGSQLGPFYELESSSPAAHLKPGEYLTHVHRTFHFKGDPKELDDLARRLLHVSLNEIANAF